MKNKFRKFLRFFKEKFPYAQCSRCKQLMPVQITEFEKKVSHKKIKVSVAHCGNCELVLNFDKDCKIQWLTREEAKELGWSIIEVLKE